MGDPRSGPLGSGHEPDTVMQWLPEMSPPTLRQSLPATNVFIHTHMCTPTKGKISPSVNPAGLLDVRSIDAIYLHVSCNRHVLFTDIRWHCCKVVVYCKEDNFYQPDAKYSLSMRRKSTVPQKTFVINCSIKAAIIVAGSFYHRNVGG